MTVELHAKVSSRRPRTTMTDPAIETMARNLEDKTGRSLESWIDLVRAQELTRHGQIISYLKSEHGMTHGYANLVAMQALHQPATEDELVAAQYSGKEHLRPIYEAALAMAMGLGADVEPAPKKTYVSLRRNKQFGLLKPASKSRMEVGLNLPDETPTDRLTATTGMCTHIVSLTSVDEVDDELRGWLTSAYERA